MKSRPPVDVITLEVSADEGERLALAATEGKLQLALRNQADSAEVVTKGATVAGLMSPALFQEPVPAGPKPAVRVIRAATQAARRQVADSVDVIRGAAMSAFKFEKGE